MSTELYDFPKTIYLNQDFRNSIFCRAYEKVGKSLAAIGRAMGYRPRRGLNGTARDMWLGKSGIPRHRIKALARVANVSLDSVRENLVSKDANVENVDWLSVYEKYKDRASKEG